MWPNYSHKMFLLYFPMKSKYTLFPLCNLAQSFIEDSSLARYPIITLTLCGLYATNAQYMAVSCYLWLLQFLLKPGKPGTNFARLSSLKA